jgi:hypothetical protein
MSARDFENCGTYQDFPGIFVLHFVQIQTMIGMSQFLREVELGFDD